MGCFKDFDGWWIIALFFLFVLFTDTIEDIEICDWIPFLILVLILCSCNEFDC
ncbi:hypothetical protein [Tepidibacter thalassicus]|uniref:Uncharacterized protein n=1 Tax=Tepidibacter thalassicus DSM 15285 TaxID=1123350 RepID=A0A1M5PFL2_9FIRM|nr:hypothetical protein [Tepidibacter thalassicus]SHH00596.1 hypothetical protein SAMN02744040_00459 [Tepidibacter thalassicus DSM 15285]